VKLFVLSEECDRLVGALRPIGLDAIGTPEWKAQREILERLNIQCHHNVAIKRDEFVYEAFHSLERLPVVVHELLVMEVWKERVYPLRKAELRKVPTLGYMYLHYEGVLVNLLEGLMFNDDAVESLGDVALELCDYCYRRVLFLNSIPDSERRIEAVDKDRWLSMAEAEHSDRADKDMAFRVSVASLAVLWMVIDRVPKGPLALTNNLLLKNDVPLQLVALLSNAPWIRRGNGVFQKFRRDGWAETPAHELLLLSPAEAHVWLSLHVLLCDPVCRSKYRFDEYRKGEILRLRRYLTERLVDQLPVLADLQRTLDHLQLMEPPASHEATFRSTLVVETFPEIYGALVKGRDWGALAEQHVQRLSDPTAVTADAQRLARLIDGLGDWDAFGPS